MHDETMNLGNLCGGRILEVVDHEISRVLKNIVDPSTPAEAKRSITIKLLFEPDENREMGQVKFSCEAKLAGVRMQKGNFFLARRSDGSVHGYARDPKQLAIFAAEPSPSPQEQ